jgi:teichuronic acid biosynthesis glycosyltransferase TuaC
MRVLSLSTVFPRPDHPHMGLFVRHRLEHLAALAEIRVVAPVPWIDYGHAQRRFPKTRGAEVRREGELEVQHPRWLYPPAFGAMNGALLSLQLMPTIARLRREFPFELIDAHFGHPEGVAAALLARHYGCPFTVTLRGSELMHGEKGPKRKRLAWALNRAAMVIAVAEPLREFAISMGVPRERTVVIPNGIDGEIYHPRDRQELRQRLGMKPGAVHFLSAGHLIELKGHHRIVAALSLLRKAGVEAELWIIGDKGWGEDGSSLIKQHVRAMDLDTFVHLSPGMPQERLAEYMSACDVFALASSREGWPNVVSEALACGTPVVATRVGGVPELLPDERYGIVVPPDDSAALEQGLRRAAERSWSREEIAAWGGSRTWGNVAAEVLAVFEEVVRVGPR